MKAKYRIIQKENPGSDDYRNGRMLNAGTGRPSWFTLEQARKLVDRSKGQTIIESDGVHILWEVF